MEKKQGMDFQQGNLECLTQVLESIEEGQSEKTAVRCVCVGLQHASTCCL